MGEIEVTGMRTRHSAPQQMHWACGCRVEISTGLPALLTPCLRHDDDVRDDVARLDACAHESPLAPARLGVISGTFWNVAELRL